ncbi:MAG: PAS domain S-box protein [Nitrospirae bacterium]|nr:PAS domain S-box protein [Nitrospirota bacterium]
MDITYRQKLAEVIFEHIRDGIVILDRNYLIIAANKSVEKWIGKPSSEIIGKSCIDVFHENCCLCPHCVATVTFETERVNIVTQKLNRGENTYYAELSAYPITDENGKVFESVVFIQDITDKMLCHDEILRLYNEVTQTKEYIEGIIENSADAIVTSDLNGIITSWNKGADKIYGFTKEEAVGKFLPFVPDFLIDPEWENNKRIRNGEVIKRIETFRKRKDGTIITVSLTLSPIKNAAGEVIGISGISRDISELKEVENELIRRNQELSRLFFISSAMRGTLELEKLLRMVLTAVTMGDGLGFNRAILFLVDDKRNLLKGAMGVGPTNPAEAGQIWESLSIEKKTLSDIMHEIEVGPSRKDSNFDKLSSSIEIPLSEQTILTMAVKEKSSFNVKNVNEEPLSDAVLIQKLGTQAYATVPLISRDKVIGVLWVDNYFNNKPILEEDMRFLNAFSNHVAAAIENARLFEQVRLTEQELENIFESISDMVYFVNSDYVIKSINKAVSKKLGKSSEEIIGRKCYEIFHGSNEPWINCPHQKTVETGKASVNEIEDEYLGGTFITSSSPIFDMSGQFIGTVNVVRDVTEMKILREKLVKTQRMAALGEVAARVAHEIRNPLISLGGFARRLTKNLDGNLKDYADIIAKEVLRLEGILNEILSFVKEVRISKETINSQKLMDDALSVIQSEIDEKHINIVRNYEQSAEVFVDPNRFKEALLNILKNAVQAVSADSSIFVKTYTKNGLCVFEINDTGTGISEENMPFIFDPFFTTKESGTGLGLAITNRIVEEHGGTINVESNLGKGSTFRVFIPLAEYCEKKF